MSDESVRWSVMNQTGDNRNTATPAQLAARHMTELSRTEAIRLLGSVSLGRIVFTQNALPAIRPVNHVLDPDGKIVIRTHAGAALTMQLGRTGRGAVVVAYEADTIDPATHQGWSVIVTGYARLITDPTRLAHYQTMLEPWIDQSMDHAVRIHPTLVTGFRLTASPRPG
jgi:nitroimidazol reductase NimA-like FMN-containing flavoprotein (pyridoxamine 5'-phosphate oxidase superfamily)